jgi:hypothetical protein
MYSCYTQNYYGPGGGNVWRLRGFSPHRNLLPTLKVAQKLSTFPNFPLVRVVNIMFAIPVLTDKEVENITLALFQEGSCIFTAEIVGSSFSKDDLLFLN